MSDTPSDTLTLAGDGLLGRVIDAAYTPLDGRGELADVHPAALAGAALGAPAPWETGIKVIDVYAPIARGATVALIARPKVGMIVMICELIHRLASQHGGCAVFGMLETERRELKELIGQLAESGVERHTALIAGRLETPPAERRHLVQTALTIAEDAAARGRDTLLVLDDGLAIAETVDLLRRRARALDRGSLTIVLCFWRHAGETPTLAPAVAALLESADAQIMLSSELASRSIWPAVDALASRSRLLTEGLASSEQLRVAEAGRALLRGGDAALSERAQKLLLFQSQPFFVAEPFTARPAEYVPLAASVRAFGAIAAGAYDQTPPDALRFVGAAQPPADTTAA
jgi:F-type H+/Na+-transporting ATPase subunit beta